MSRPRWAITAAPACRARSIFPSTDTLFLRVALNSENQKGYIANYFFDPATGRRNNQAAMGSKKLAGMFSLKWQPDDSFNIVLRADIAAEHDTGSTYHDLGYFTGTVPSAGKTSICNIPGDLRRLHRPARPGDRALLPDRHRHQRQQPQSVAATYNTLLNSLAREQAAGFWSTEQDVSNLDAGHYQTLSATANKSFDDIDVRLMAAYRTFDNTGTAVSRGQPFETNTYQLQFPQLSILAVGTDRQRQGAGRQAEMDHRPVLFQRKQPQ